MNAVMTVSAGWYADPVRADVLRWWDGEGWSRHTSDEVTSAPSASAFDGADLPAPDPDLDSVGYLADSFADSDSFADADAGAEADERRRTSALWLDTATRIRALVTHAPAVLHVAVDDLAPIVIDTRYHAYGWRYPLVGLPPAPQRIAVEVVPSAPLAPTVFGLHHGAVTELLAAIEALVGVEAA